jgi:hypothetical protein
VLAALLVGLRIEFYLFQFFLPFLAPLMKLLFRLFSSKTISDCLHKFIVIFVLLLVINVECSYEFSLREKFVIGSDVVNKNEDGCCDLIFDGLFKLSNE